MRYITDRKRATGHGSAGTGTEHHWSMTLSSVGLLILVPLFIFTFGPILGADYEEAVLFYSRPFPALVAGLTFVVGFHHFRGGAEIMIEDYVGGYARKVSIALVACLAYGLMAAGLFAVLSLAL